jgi:hypothetical protein
MSAANAANGEQVARSGFRERATSSGTNGFGRPTPPPALRVFYAPRSTDTPTRAIDTELGAPR